MIVELQLDQDKNGKVTNAAASYQPEEKVRNRIAEVHKWLVTAYQVRNKPYREFNNLSLLDRINADQMSWNQYVEWPSMDPAESWKSRAFRPIVRNKIIAIAAHITASIITPMIAAQDDDDDEDRDAAMVMSDIMEWVNDHSDYDKSFIYAVISAMVNPCGYVYTEYAERYRMEREKGKDPKKVLDEILSGIRDFVVPCDEIWITDAYEHDIQKQEVVIWRRVISYDQAKSKHGGNKEFDEYVRPGLQMVLGADALFYEAWDRSLSQNLVEELIIWHRGQDLRLTMINGVMVSDCDEPNPRVDKMIPLVKFGYELIDEGRFFWFKSLAFKMAPDEEVINTTYRMVIDGSWLQLMPPAVIGGDESIQSPVMVPGVITTVTNPDARSAFQPIQTGGNLSAGHSILERVEASASESSTSSLQGGQAPGGGNTAYEISLVEKNSQLLLGLFGKMVAFAVKDWGQLKIGDILQHMTVGDATDTMNGAEALKFRKFLLTNKRDNGKPISRQVEFDMGMPSGQIKSDKLLGLSFGIQKKQFDMGDTTKIFKVNPELFRKMKFKVRVQPEAIAPKSQALEKAEMLEQYGLAMQNPLTNKESITRDLLLGAYKKTEADPDKYMMEQPPAPAPGMPPMPGQPAPGQEGAMNQANIEAGNKIQGATQSPMMA